jgi:hypothetical protein
VHAPDNTVQNDADERYEYYSGHNIHNDVETQIQSRSHIPKPFELHGVSNESIRKGEITFNS